MSWFYFLVFSSIGYLTLTYGAKQPYDIRLVKVFDCSYPANGNTTTFNIDIKHINKTSFLLVGDYTVFQNLDNDISLHVAADMKSKGEYREKLFVNDLGPLCDGMKKLSPKFFATLFGNGDVEKMCPIAKGKYAVESQPMVIELPNVNTLPFGAYRVKFEGHQGPSKVFCIAVFADVIKP